MLSMPYYANDRLCECCKCSYSNAYGHLLVLRTIATVHTENGKFSTKTATHTRCSQIDSHKWARVSRIDKTGIYRFRWWMCDIFTLTRAPMNRSLWVSFLIYTGLIGHLHFVDATTLSGIEWLSSGWWDAIFGRILAYLFGPLWKDCNVAIILIFWIFPYFRRFWGFFGIPRVFVHFSKIYILEEKSKMYILE